jgi:hypothetical protein
MTSSLRALLEDSIDYAGMFPPASLGLEEAAANYCRYRCEPEAWMLGSFVCPIAKLDEFFPLVRDEIQHGSTSEHRFRVTGLLTGGEKLDAFLETTRREEQSAREGPLCSRMQTLEVRVPGEVVAQGDFRFLENWLRVWILGEAEARMVYLELPLDSQPAVSGGWPRLLHRLASEIRRRERTSFHSSSYKVGIKIRTGGVSPELVPSSAALATAICGVRDEGLRWKATAGLHQPLCHFDSSVGCKVHGFVNLFVAAVMADVHRLVPTAVEAILDDEDPSAFVFEENDVRWRDYTASVSEIARFRLLESFGSCSFDEPRDGLRKLGWL